MKMINQVVGENLKKIRELSGFTQEEVAKSIGVERSTYSNYEGGIREIPYHVLENVSNLFGCEAFVLSLIHIWPCLPWPGEFLAGLRYLF